MSAKVLQSLLRLGDLQPVDWLRYMGFFVWMLIAIALLVLPLLSSEGTYSLVRMVGWWAAALLFLVAFLHPAVRLQRRSAF